MDPQSDLTTEKTKADFLHQLTEESSNEKPETTTTTAQETDPCLRTVTREEATGRPVRVTAATRHGEAVNRLTGI